MEDVASGCWTRMDEATGVMCKKKKSTLKVKGEFYEIVARSAMVYGWECWV